jgi:hypothetical protein
MTVRPPKNKLPHEVHDSPVLPLLRDAIQYAREAEHEGVRDREQRLARVAILLASAMPDAAANVCLANLRHRGVVSKARKRTDDQTTIGKLRRILGYMPGKQAAQLPLAAPLYLSLAELLAARSSMVHAQRVVRKLRAIDITKTFVPEELGTYPNLGIPVWTRQWRFPDSVTCLRAMSECLNDFFAVQCGLDQLQSTKLLTTVYVFDDFDEWPQRSEAVVDSDFNYAIDNWGLTLAFLNGKR